MMIKAHYLKKTKHARLLGTDTILMEGGNAELKESCKNNEIVGVQSFKSSDETGDGTDEFVHVIRSVLQKHRFPVVVKIHDSQSYFVEKELFALNRLADFENSVKKICDFSCLDDKSRWKNMIHSPVKFCNNKHDKLHFIVLEYIDNGDIESFLAKNPSRPTICSLFLQVELAIIKLALDYRLSHGDLNSGNIMISATEKSRIHYRVLDKEYRITSHGILPKLIDYGRCTKYVGKIYPSYILDDIYTCLSVLVMYIKDEELKAVLKEFIYDESRTNSTDLARVLMETKRVFEGFA